MEAKEMAAGEILVGNGAPYCMIGYGEIEKGIKTDVESVVYIQGTRKDDISTTASHLAYYRLECSFIRWKGDVYEFSKYYGGGSFGMVYEMRKVGGRIDGGEVTIKMIIGDDKIEETILVYIRAYCERMKIRGVRLPWIVGVMTNIKLRATVDIGWMRYLTPVGRAFYEKDVVGGKIRGILTRPVGGTDVSDLRGHFDIEEVRTGKEGGKWIREFDWGEYVYYFSKDMLEALEVVHACGIIHNDIKPENILVSRENVGGRKEVYRFTLVDFGIGIRYREKTGERHCPDGMGGVGTTPFYSTMNHIREVGITRRMDMCQFCYVLFEVVYGVMPYWCAYATTGLIHSGIGDFLARFVGGKRMDVFSQMVEFSSTRDAGRYVGNLKDKLKLSGFIIFREQLVHAQFFAEYAMLDLERKRQITEGMCCIWTYCFELGYYDVPDYRFVEASVNELVMLMRR